MKENEPEQVKIENEKQSENVESQPEPKPKSHLRLWAEKHKEVIFIVLSVLAFGWNWIQQYETSKVQAARQAEIERKIAEQEKKAIHLAETNYSILISGMLQTGTIMETNLIEERNHKKLLIDCARKNNCSDDLLVEKHQKPYVPMAQHYFNVKQQMTDESLEDR